MMKVRYQILLFFSLAFTLSVSAQDLSSIRLNGESGIEKEISLLMNDLNLRNDQKLSVGILLFKYGASFNYNEFDNAGKSKQYAMARSTIKSLDKDLKQILDKGQFKVYKKHKKKIKKELMHST